MRPRVHSASKDFLSISQALGLAVVPDPQRPERLQRARNSIDSVCEFRMSLWPVQAVLNLHQRVCKHDVTRHIAHVVYTWAAHTRYDIALKLLNLSSQVFRRHVKINHSH